MCTPRSPSSSGRCEHRRGREAQHVEAADQVDADTLSNSSRLCGPRRPAVFSAGPMPAQQTEIRRPPRPPPGRRRPRRGSASVTSVFDEVAPISLGQRRPRSALRSAIVTLAPAARRARAVAAPRPDAPPATSAFTPSICMGWKLAQTGGFGSSRCAPRDLVATELRLHPQARGNARLEAERWRLYSQVRESVTRLVETTFEPALGGQRDRARQPCEGGTGSGRRTRPVARNAYGALRSRPGLAARARAPWARSGGR